MAARRVSAALGRMELCGKQWSALLGTSPLVSYVRAVKADSRGTKFGRKRDVRFRKTISYARIQRPHRNLVIGME